ncbi:MAG: M56 family metallopeptidase, partial [Methylococcaceae bacterium]
MNDFIVYILKSTFCLSLLYLTFRTVMRKEAFFALNRMLLLVVVFCSILIPIINLPQIIHPEMQQKLMPAFPVIENQLPEFPVVADPPQFSGSVNAIAEKPERTFPVMEIIGYMYLAGMLISLLILIHGLATLLLLFRKAEIQKMEGFKLLIIEKDIPAFSFWKMIFISRADYIEHGNTILAHEQQHIRLGHFYDLMLMEIAKIAHWFNPVIYWLIQDLKTIHEFQADQSTLTKGIDVNKYQLLIIEKGVGSQRFALANSFNHCQIKKRITMMNKSKTSKAGIWKVATFLPLLA